MRAKFLYEKFTEDSDPIADMNIGMMRQIKEWLESTGRDFRNKHHALTLCSYFGKTEFVKYLLDIGVNVYDGSNDPLRWASANGHVEIVKLLLDAGANAHIDNSVALRWAAQNGHYEVVKVLQDHMNKQNLKESLNEKFTEDSDPIEDLNIGGEDVYELRQKFKNEKEFKKFLNRYLKNKIISAYMYLWYDGIIKNIVVQTYTKRYTVKVKEVNVYQDAEVVIITNLDSYIIPIKKGNRFKIIEK